MDGLPPSAGQDPITDAVHALLRCGMPPVDSATLDELLVLPAVVSRAVDPEGRASRLRALEGWLRWTLARFEPPQLAEPARLLFGAVPGAVGLTLTDRRAKAARAAGYEVHHFRKRIEPRIRQRLTAVLAADCAEAGARAVPPRLARPHRPLRLPADVFAWEAAEHEQAISALWSEVYALRAALLAVARLAGMNGAQHPETEAAAGIALWRVALLHGAVLAYRDAYGPQLLGAEPGTGPEDLAVLAGWHPHIDPNVLDQLVATAAHGHRGVDHLLNRLPPLAADAARCWLRELARASTVPSIEQESWI